MRVASTPTGLAITNPLVLYRSLLATKRIDPDPAQHRFAIHLQGLYHRLKDYEPKVEYRHQLRQLTSVLEKSRVGSGGDHGVDHASSGLFSSLRARKLGTDTLALSRRLTHHESALDLQSPKGLLLHGEVGTGKSMLIDLLANSLPTSKKRRWHFNTFMLETFAKLEKLRVQQSSVPVQAESEHSLLWVAREMIATSPIIFLDEFQLPDRAASKILSNLFTSFFHLGGVLVASSNRMPEELIKASGVEFAPPPSPFGLPGLRGSFENLGKGFQSTTMPSQQQSDFAAFLELLRARCDIWDMEGSKDWRRHEASKVASTASRQLLGDKELKLENVSTSNLGHGEKDTESSRKVPTYYFLSLPSSTSCISEEQQNLEWEETLLRTVLGNSLDQESTIPWQASTLRIYGRDVPISNHYKGVAMFTFKTLCTSHLGPADYISIASSFHTIILMGVPVLHLLQKNEARRFITLLDALYESRCKLLVQAEAGPDQLFFPETQAHFQSSGMASDAGKSDDEIYSETFSEIYQDQTSPFRPNVSSYSSSASSPAYTSSPLPFSESNSASTRSILADEDSDFGPTYGAGRSSFPEVRPSQSSTDVLPLAFNDNASQGKYGSKHKLNFQQTGVFTGEDERFAYKRASSRLWEMCGKKWWDRDEEGWWNPLSTESRPWESTSTQADRLRELRPLGNADPSLNDRLGKGQSIIHEATAVRSFSPFRTRSDPPPRISDVHVWGIMKWGKRAGKWGLGTEGLGKGKQRTKNDNGKESSNKK